MVINWGPHLGLDWYPVSTLDMITAAGLMGDPCGADSDSASQSNTQVTCTHTYGNKSQVYIHTK